jgi:DNA-binding NtrC family response regulator
MSSSISILVAAAPSPDSRALIQQIESEFTTFIRQAADLSSLYKNLKDSRADILIVDTVSPQFEIGIELVRKLRKDYPSLLILPLIPADRRELIQQMLSLDVFLYIHTPIEPAETTLALTRATEHLGQKAKADSTRRQDRPDFHGMIGSCPPMQKLFDLIIRVAEDDDSTVLIRGESGTGKEMVAKAIHAQSARNSKNFVAVNCAAIPDDLLESELFGYTKGAFTGALSNKIGRIQYADGGTLFLDEIGDMKPTLQAKLLRVLQEKEFEPVGALKPIPVDTRVLAATHCDLEQLVSEGIFREDLYYRLSVIPLSIPPLKERREDIPLLIKKFIQSFSNKRNREPFIFSQAASIALENFEWRGNVRELENLIQHMSILYGGKQVEFDDLPEKFLDMRQLVEDNMEPLQIISDETDEDSSAEITHQPVSAIPWHEGPVDFRELINSFETELIVHAMKLTGGNKKEAARLLNLKRTTLLEKIKKKDLNNLWEE